MILIQRRECVEGVEQITYYHGIATPSAPMSNVNDAKNYDVYDILGALHSIDDRGTMKTTVVSGSPPETVELELF